MKAASVVGLGLAAVAACSSVNAVNYDVATCAELANIDGTTVTSLTITSVYFECVSYTRFPVHNDMTLRSDAAVVFINFALEVLGNLTVVPDVTFRDVTEQVTDGGALYVEKGSSVTFLGETHFLENTVVSTYIPSTSTGDSDDDAERIVRSGGAIFNEGDIVFEDLATFAENRALATDPTDVGRGGAIYNGGGGSIAFNGPLTALWNIASGYFGGSGGAIFNAGEIVIGNTSSFAGNTAAEDGGAIYVDPNGTITFNDFATFKENKCYEKKGGAVINFGSLNLASGSLFQGNVAASSSGDGGFGGGIYNGGEGSLSFGGDNTFNRNWGFKGGAIYNELEATILPPQDGGALVFQNLRGTNCPGIYYEPADGADHVCGP